MKKFWQIKNQTQTNKAELLLYGPISDTTWWGDEVTPKQFAADLASLGSIDELIVRINSGGGDVYAGLAIYNLLRSHRAKVTAYIDGMAASIASVVAMAADKIIIPTGAMMMVHNPALGLLGYYEETDLRDYADYLSKVKDSIVDIYAARTGKSAEELAAIMDAETWMTAREAVELGFADEVDASIKVAAQVSGNIVTVNGVAVDISKFNRPPFLNGPGEGVTDKMVINAETILKQYPSVYEEIRKAGFEEGVKAERQRIKAIEDLALPGCKEIINRAKFETGAAAEAVAIEIIKAQRETAAKKLSDLIQDAADLNKVPVDGAPQDDTQEVKNMAAIIAAAVNKKRGVE